MVYINIFFGELFLNSTGRRAKNFYIYQILYIIMCAIFLSISPKEKYVNIFMIMLVIFSISAIIVTLISTQFEYFTRLLFKNKHKKILKKIYQKEYNFKYLLGKIFCNIYLIFLSLLTGFLIKESVIILVSYILFLILIDLIYYLLIYICLKKERE